MEELKKINRIIQRELGGRSADETLLVLDATTGQNAVNQAREFKNAVSITGLILAKLDGTARGGIVITIKDELGVPIKLIGTGEKIGDIEVFNPPSLRRRALRVGANLVFAPANLPTPHPHFLQQQRRGNRKCSLRSQ